MKIPETVKITPFVYRVSLVNKLVNDNYRHHGTCSTSELLIELDDGNDEQRQRHTFFHEAIHAISNHAKLNFDEETVERLTNGLVALLVDNDLLKE